MVNFDYLYNPAAAKNILSEDHFADKKLDFQVIENGTILPYKRTVNGHSAWGFGGIVDSKGRYKESSSLYKGLGVFPYTPPQK